MRVQLHDNMKKVWRGVVRLLLVLTVLVGGGHGAKAQLNTDAVMVIGRNALYYEDYALSIQYFNQIISAKPHLYLPYYYRAIAKYYLGDYVGAIDDCTMSVERDPYIVEVYRLRAINYIRVEDYEDASKDYDVLIKDLKVKDRDVWYNLVLCKSQLKQNDEADHLLDSMIVTWPDYSRSYMLKAQIALGRNDTIAADSLLRHTLVLDSANVDAISALAFISLRRGQYQKAESEYTRAISISPNQTPFYVNRALARYQQTDLRGAMDDYNAALETNPNNYLAHYNRALLCMQVGENNKAIVDFDFVLSHHPDDRLALYNRAILAQQTGDFKRAIKDYTTIIAEFPKFTGAYVNRSYCYRKIGDRRRSDADDRRAMQLQLDFAYTHTEAKSPLDSVTRNKSDVDIEDYDKLVTDDQENMAPSYASQSRGLVQNKQVAVDYQPLYALTFFKTDNGLNSSSSDQSEFVDELNKSNRFFGPLSLSAREMPLTEQQYETVNQHRKAVEDLLLDSPQNGTLLFVDALYLSVERNYEQALKNLNMSEHQTYADSDSVSVKLGMYCLRADVKAKLVELQSSAKDLTTPDNAKMKYLGAVNDLSEALKLNAHDAILYYNRATLYARSYEYSKAIADFDKALELNPLLAEAYYNRGLAYIYSDNKQQGFSDLSKAGELGLFTAYSLIKHFRK